MDDIIDSIETFTENETDDSTDEVFDNKKDKNVATQTAWSDCSLTDKDSAFSFLFYGPRLHIYHNVFYFFRLRFTYFLHYYPYL